MSNQTATLDTPKPWNGRQGKLCHFAVTFPSGMDSPCSPPATDTSLVTLVFLFHRTFSEYQLYSQGLFP